MSIARVLWWKEKGPVALAMRFLFVLQGDRSYYDMRLAKQFYMYEQTKQPLLAKPVETPSRTGSSAETISGVETPRPH